MLARPRLNLSAERQGLTGKGENNLLHFSEKFGQVFGTRNQCKKRFLEQFYESFILGFYVNVETDFFISLQSVMRRYDSFEILVQKMPFFRAGCCGKFCTADMDKSLLEIHHEKIYRHFFLRVAQQFASLISRLMEPQSDRDTQKLEL